MFYLNFFSNCWDWLKIFVSWLCSHLNIQNYWQSTSYFVNLAIYNNDSNFKDKNSRFFKKLLDVIESTHFNLFKPNIFMDMIIPLSVHILPEADTVTFRCTW